MTNKTIANLELLPRLELTYVTILAANFANHTYNLLIRLQQQITRSVISDHISLVIQRTSFTFYHVTYACQGRTNCIGQATNLRNRLSNHISESRTGISSCTFPRHVFECGNRNKNRKEHRFERPQCAKFLDHFSFLASAISIPYFIVQRFPNITKAVWICLCSPVMTTHGKRQPWTKT